MRKFAAGSAILLSAHLILSGTALASTHAHGSEILAATPPMCWNSWDAYGLTITESQFRENVDVLDNKLKPSGWTYAVIDEGWFLKTQRIATHRKN